MIAAAALLALGACQRAAPARRPRVVPEDAAAPTRDAGAAPVPVARVEDAGADAGGAAANAGQPDTELALPPLPPPPSNLAPRRVAELRRRAVQLTACDPFESSRMGPYDPESACAEWYSVLQLAASTQRPTLVHALGGFLAAPDDGEVRASNRFGLASRNGSNLVELIAWENDGSALPYLLHFAVRTLRASEADASLDTMGVDSAIRTMGTITRHDVLPRPLPLPRERAEVLAYQRRAVAAWVAWWRAHGDEPVSAWRPAGLAQRRADLASADLAVRYTAIERLLAVATDRAAARDALDEVLRRGEAVPTDVQRAFTDLAEWGVAHGYLATRGYGHYHPRPAPPGADAAR